MWPPPGCWQLGPPWSEVHFVRQRAAPDPAEAPPSTRPQHSPGGSSLDWTLVPWAGDEGKAGQGRSCCPAAQAEATHSESEPAAWALPARTFMATPLRCSRPDSRRGLLMVMVPSGARAPSLEPTEDEREDAGLCSHSASFSRSRDLRLFSVSGGG